MAITPNDTFTSGQILTAQECNNFPRGVMAFTGRTTAVSNITTSQTDITGVTVTFTADSTRLYKASWVISGVKNISSGYVEVALTTGANVQIQAIDSTVGAGEFWNLSGISLFSGVSGSVTYKLRGLVQNDTATPSALATVPIYLVIEDIGGV